MILVKKGTVKKGTVKKGTSMILGQKGDVYDFMLLWQDAENFKEKHKIIDVPFSPVPFSRGPKRGRLSKKYPKRGRL